MRFFAVFAPLVTALASFAAAQSSGANPIMYPYSSVILNAGDTVQIKWNPTTPGTISLQLREGPFNDLNEGTSLASGLPNTGSFQWSIPSTTKYSAYYTIQITSDADPSDVNYSAPFPIQSSKMAASLSEASSAMGVTAMPHTSLAMPTQRPTRTVRPKISLATAAEQVTQTFIPTGAAQARDLRGGVAAALALGAGVAFAL